MRAVQRKPVALAPPKRRAKPVRPERIGAGDKSGVGGGGDGDAWGASAEGLVPGPDGLFMPEPPAAPSPQARRRLSSVVARAEKKTTAQASLPAPKEQSDGAQQAVATPLEERQAAVDQGLVKALGIRPEPDPKIVQLCERIREAILAKRPKDEDALLETDTKAVAEAAGREVGQDANAAMEGVERHYDALQARPTAPVEPPPPGITPLPDAAPTPGLNAAAAVPEPLPPANLSLDEDVAHQQGEFVKAGMDTEPARLVQGGPIAEGRKTLGALAQTAAEEAAKLLEAQRLAREKATTDMVELQEAAVAALARSRARSVKGSRAQQEAMVGTEESLRAKAMERANHLFEGTQKVVRRLLLGLSDKAMARWNEEIKVSSARFEERLRVVRGKVADRHSGVGGWFVSKWDWATGLPGWVTKEYDAAELEFSDSACGLAKRISSEVNGVILACERLIDETDAEIAGIFEKLKVRMPQWAVEQQALFAERLGGLRKETRKAKTDFTQRLAERAAETVNEVREKVAALRQKAKGMIGKIKDFVVEFVKDPARTLINGLLDLLGISRSAFWAVVKKIGQIIGQIADDPIGFAKKLFKGIADGFDGFFKRFGEYLLKGLLAWLFKGLGEAGVEVPRDLSLKSVVSFLLQLMGISWEKIRRLIARRVGERNVAMVEKAWEHVSVFAKEGVGGLYELLKGKLNPQALLDKVLETVKDAVVEAILINVAKRVLLLFNPVGAILAAIEAIYRVLKWIFQNAAKIFTLIEAVVNGMSAILAGNVVAMAKAVEAALAGLIAPVIAFFADYFGLGNIPNKIRRLIERMQSWVEGLLDRVIGFIAEQVKRLGGAIQSGARALVTWWRERRKFRGQDGEAHAVYFRGAGKGATLMVASDPTPFATFIAEVEAQTPETKAAKREAQRLAALMDAVLAGADAEGQLSEGSLKALRGHWDALAQQLTILFAGTALSSRPVYGSLSPRGAYASSMVVLKMTHRLGDGSRPSVKGNPLFDTLNLRRSGNGSYYVLGHLLNEHLGGPGDTWQNLTPLSRSANAQHERTAERFVKEAVLKHKKTVRYEVFAVYGRTKPSPALDELKRAPPFGAAALQRILEAEQHIPSKLVLRAQDAEGARGARTKGDKLELTGEVQNTVEDQRLSDYTFDGAPKLKELNLNEAIAQRRTDLLQLLPGIGPQRANDLLGLGPFHTWDAVQVPGVPQSTVNTWRTMEPRVKLRGAMVYT